MWNGHFNNHRTARNAFQNFTKYKQYILKHAVIHNEPQWATVSQNKPQWARMSLALTLTSLIILWQGNYVAILDRLQAPNPNPKKRRIYNMLWKSIPFLSSSKHKLIRCIAWVTQSDCLKMSSCWLFVIITRVAGQNAAITWITQFDQLKMT